LVGFNSLIGHLWIPSSSPAGRGEMVERALANEATRPKNGRGSVQTNKDSPASAGEGLVRARSIR
jgi:hypothetical protein